MGGHDKDGSQHDIRQGVLPTPQRRQRIVRGGKRAGQLGVRGGKRNLTPTTEMLFPFPLY